MAVGYYCGALSRRSTLKAVPATAKELGPTAPKTVELEQRLARVEMSCDDLLLTNDLLKRQLTALTARLDYLAAVVNKF
jgi:hypothetical protein